MQNGLLCQWTADALDMDIKAGPIETTSVGNLLMQMKALGDIGSIGEGRMIAAASSDIIDYHPRPGNNWEEHFRKYKQLHEVFRCPEK